MSHPLLLAFLLPLFVGTGEEARPVAPSSVSAPEPAAADTPRTTPAGTTFMLPAGWSMTTKGSAAILQPPEEDSRLAVVDVDAKDSDAAVAAAWAAFKPDFKRPLKLATPQAPRNGWEERRVYTYETSPNERATVFALAFRAGKAWTVTIIDASDSTFEKREGPFSLVMSSLRPKGYQRETFAGKKAHPVDAKTIAAVKEFLADGMKQLRRR